MFFHDDGYSLLPFDELLLAGPSWKNADCGRLGFRTKVQISDKHLFRPAKAGGN
jgi:hypothetical protein